MKKDVKKGDVAITGQYLGVVEEYLPNKEMLQTRLEHLKQLGVYDKIKGIVIGYNYSFQDPNIREEKRIDVDFEDMVLEATKNYDFPILTINEFGHRCNHAFLPIGVDVEMDATNKTIKIIGDFVE